MNGVKIIKSTQEQASAAWINYLNQLRLDELFDALSKQDMNLENALIEMNKLKKSIVSEVVDKNRGGNKGMHGFIGERVQVYIENARKLIEGLSQDYNLIDDNGPTDYMRRSIPIQQKCVQNKFGLDAIKEHAEKYPGFIDNGIYQIPKDYYEKLKKLAVLKTNEAGKLTGSDYRIWKEIQDLQNEYRVGFEKIEPMVADYSEIQAGKFDDTIEREKESLKNKSQELKDNAYEKSRPTLKEGAKVTAVSAAMEGGVSFCLKVIGKLKSGKRLNEFTEDDWKDVGLTTAADTAKGGIRGASVYALTNFTATPANVASALVTATFGIVSQANQFGKGSIDSEEFIINSEIVCLDVSISAISSILGQIAIPVPVLGALIGNVVGLFMYGIAKDFGLKKEEECIKKNNRTMVELNKRLDDEHRKLVELLTEKFKQFKSAVELAFDFDINIAFDSSIKLAELTGVDSNKILRNEVDISNYFTI